MNSEIESSISRFDAAVQARFRALAELVVKSADGDAEEKLWAKLPSYYVGERFVRLIPFKDHINIEAAALLNHAAELCGYKFTPKGMMQLGMKQEIPAEILQSVFRETLLG